MDLNDETLPTFIKRKHRRNQEKKETNGKGQSPGKQTAQNRRATRKEREGKLDKTPIP
jgi:hypothetical protein